MWGSLGRRTPLPKLAWSGALTSLQHTVFEDLRAGSNAFATDRTPKARHHKVRARLFAGKQVLSLWGTLNVSEQAALVLQTAIGLWKRS